MGHPTHFFFSKQLIIKTYNISKGGMFTKIRETT